MAPARSSETPSQLSADSPDPAKIARDKEAAARAAAELVRDGMAVGLGTGSTVAFLLRALGERAGELRAARFAATSPATARIAGEAGLSVHGLDELTGASGALDLAIDGADQVDPDGWLIKGGGGAHTREKIVAAAARRFVVIVSPEKLVPRLAPPVPLEVLEFGARHTLAGLDRARLRAPDERGVGSPTPLGGDAGVGGDASAGGSASAGAGAGADASAGGRRDEGIVRSPDGNLLAWYEAPFADPRALAERLSRTPGVVEHGLFAPEMVSEVLVGDGGGVRRRAGDKAGD
jgi:ribose 5-phosphate isomerase A